jgi:class 3 adenylate cyclase
VPAKERRYRWEWWFDAPPSRVWPLISDTDRVDRLAGLPPARYAPAQSGDGRLDVRQTFYGVLALRYEEDPFDWVAEERYRVERRFENGPAARMRIEARLEPDERGTKVVIELAVLPRGLLGAMMLPFSMRAAKSGYERAYARLRAEATGPAPDPPARAAIEREALRRLARGEPKATGRAAERLATHLASADAAELRRIRPFALADRWGVSRRDALVTCLLAVRAGVLELSFEAICPHCRGAKSSVPGLSRLSSRQRCEPCAIEFEAEFDRSVEAVFRPAPDLRRVDANVYCVGGPGTTAHVVTQVRTAPGETTDMRVPLESGAHRARSPRRGRAAELRAGDAPAAPEGPAVIEVGDEGVVSATPSVAAGTPRVSVRNVGTKEAVVLVERMRWLDDVATAMDVVAVPGFTDLFAAEVLAPGERIAVRRVAILFTDLRGSTALYRRVGDAAAYALVREHFTALRAAVAANGGMLVKTIGDAVMAAFRTAGEAVAAALAMHESLAKVRGPAGEALVLKAGVHQGPSIVVAAGGRLDFFGTTTNLAARAQHESVGGDVVLTGEVLDDADVARALAALPHATDSFSARLKGFDEPVTLHRIAVRSQSNP